MVKFECQETQTYDGAIHYRFDVGIVNEFQVACQISPPDGVITKEHLIRVCYQLADHLSDNRYSNQNVESAELMTKILLENKRLKEILNVTGLTDIE